MRIGRVLALLITFLFLASSQSKATPLNLVATNNAPDFNSNPLSVTYDAGNQTFLAVAVDPEQPILVYNYAGQDPLYFYGDFTLTATITSAGVLTGGSLTIDGDLGPGETNLLTATLHPGSDGIVFGSNNSVPGHESVFEFLFTVSGGDPTMVNDFGGLGAANGGVILTALFNPLIGDTAFTGSWANSFSDSFSQGGVVDCTVVVPEPSSIVLLLVGGFVCVVTHRCCRKSKRVPDPTRS